MAVGEDRFCPKCGAPRQPGMSFCGRCGYGFPSRIQIEPARGIGGAARASDLRPPAAGGERLAAAPAEPARGEVNQVALLAGLAWILTAAVGGYIAFLQWDFSQYAASIGQRPDDYRLSAVFNALEAALTVYFGARCIGDPPRGFLSTSTAWGVLSVAFGVYQVANGGTSPLLYLSFVLAGIAGVLSFAARDRAPIPGA